jgi:hypothetical protein
VIGAFLIVVGLAVSGLFTLMVAHDCVKAKTEQDLKAAARLVVGYGAGLFSVCGIAVVVIGARMVL